MMLPSDTERVGKEAFHKPMLVLVVSLFYMWGVANNLNDVLITQFKKTFVLSDLQAGLVQSAFYLGYFLCAIPAALFMQRYGYKAAIVLGLLLYGMGALMFYPAAELRQYAPFLCALFVIAAGLSFLETAANPLMASLGSPDGAERRLNLAQSFNPLGAITGVLIGREFILSGVQHTQQTLRALSAADVAAFYEREAHAVQVPYLVLGVVVIIWAFVVVVTKFPQSALASTARTAQQRPFKELFAHRRFLLGVSAQFFYVGAQVGVWSYLIRYAQHAVPDMGEKTAAAYLTGSLIAFMAGRFIGTALMWRYSAAHLLALFAGANAMLMVLAVVMDDRRGLLALAASSFFMSIMFPTIFALGLRELGDLTKRGASLMVMAIIGGAVLTALMGFISDVTSINIAMSVPALCFVVVGLFALTVRPDCLRASSAVGP